jgi:4-hydroxy-tetrahydrodipicolinate synthase
MADPRFKGSGVALVTPFDKKGVNERVLREIVRFHLREETDALIVNGSTGEAATMSPEEQRVAVAIVVDENKGKLPVIVGCGGSDTAQVSRLATQARVAGADALLLSAPPYNKPTQQGLLAHFRAVMDAGQLPAVIYNVPGRSAVNIIPPTIAELAKDERVIGVKEACGDITQIGQLAYQLREYERVFIWSGNDDQIVPIMSLGGQGVISVLANVAPRDTSRMAHAFLKGDVKTARTLQLKYFRLIAALFVEPNPIPVKTAVGWLGFDVGELRLPLTPISEPVRQNLLAALQDVGIAPLTATA